MGDQVRPILLAGLAEMNFVARPARFPFFAITSFWVIGRVDEQFAQGKIVVAAPVKLPLDPDRVLQPDAPQDLDRRDLTQEDRSIGGVESAQQVRPILADPFRLGLTVLLTAWKATFLNAMSIAIQPFRLTVVE